MASILVYRRSSQQTLEDRSANPDENEFLSVLKKFKIYMRKGVEFVPEL